jgi:hypothetical protein
MNDVGAIAAGKTAEANLKAERDKTAKEHAARLDAEHQLQMLRSEAGIKQSGSDAATLARVRKSSDQDDLGCG